MEQFILDVKALEDLLAMANGGSPRSLIFTTKDERKILALYRGTYLWGWRQEFTKQIDFDAACKALVDAGFTEVDLLTPNEYITGWV